MLRYAHVRKADIRTPLLGTSFDSKTAVTLAEGMDSLACEIISWAHLQLDKGSSAPAAHRSVLGAGGTSRVFKGKFKNEPVAIKMLYCVTLTPDTVTNFFQESCLLSRLRHPNVVHMKGVCVTPPSICMVMELCKGSLYAKSICITERPFHLIVRSRTLMARPHFSHFTESPTCCSHHECNQTLR